MKKSTIVLIVLATLLAAAGIYYLFYKLACKGGHGMASRGCCCCSSYGSGGTGGQGQTSVLGSGRPSTTVVMPPGVVPGPSDSLFINIAGGSTQPVTFNVTLPSGSTVVPTLYVYKKNPLNVWVYSASITGGMYTINNFASTPKDYALFVKYNGAENFDALTYYPEADGHGFDAHYSRDGVTATVGVH